MSDQDQTTSHILDRLHTTVQARKGADPASSYTASLFHKGRGKIAQKLGEEAVECVIEAMRDDGHAIVAESADLLYHLTVLWADAGVEPAQVWAALEARVGTSGLDEKAARVKD
jgi:phosphoribosyl-ATP pyrophosphohydrolase